MKAIKSGIITKSTKSELIQLEAEQENIKTLIAQEQIERPIISKEQIEAWIMNFAKIDLNNEKQKQRIIDVFINSIYVYDDRLIVFFNYKDGEKCIDFDELHKITKKENTHKCECSSLVTIVSALKKRFFDLTRVTIQSHLTATVTRSKKQSNNYYTFFSYLKPNSEVRFHRMIINDFVFN